MTDSNRPDFEKFGGIRERSPWYANILKKVTGCEFAICGVVAIYWLNKSPSSGFEYACLAAIAVLGIASAMIRKRE